MMGHNYPGMIMRKNSGYCGCGYIEVKSSKSHSLEILRSNI